jgi:preprotein translocase subunit SecD
MRAVLAVCLAGIALVAAATAPGAGREVAFQAAVPAKPLQMEQTAAKLRGRFKLAGYRNATVRVAGDRILVRFPRAMPALARRLATEQGNIGFYNLGAAQVAGPSRTPIRPRPHTFMMRCSRVCPGRAGRGSGAVYYLLSSPWAVGTWYLRGPETRVDVDPVTHQRTVLVSFTARGAARFRALTKAVYELGAARKERQHIAIVLDLELVSWPAIDYTDPGMANGIDGRSGVAIFTGAAADAKRIAVELQSGPLRVPLRASS